MKRDGEPALVRVLNGPGRADDARAARDQDPLAVGRIERDRDHGEHGSGEIARELREQHPFEERALIDPLPTRRVGGPDAPAGLNRSRCRTGGLLPGHGRRRSGDARGPEEKLLRRQLALERPERLLEGGESRLDRVLEERHIRVGRAFGASAVGFGRPGRGVRSPGRAGDRQGAERAGSALQLLQPKRLPKLRLGRAHAWDQGCGVRRLRLGLEPSHLLGGRGLPALELGARPGGGLQSLPLGLLPNAVLEGPSHPVVDRLRLGQGYESVGFLGTRHRPREEESADEHGDQHHARLRHDAARQRAFRRARPTASNGSSEAVPGREPPSGPLVADLEPPVAQYVAGDVEALLTSGRTPRAPVRRPGAHRGPATPGRGTAGR